MNIQSVKFKELDTIMSKFIEKIDEVKYIHQVELILDSYYKYGLKSLADGIQEGKFNHVINNISELYLYSTLAIVLTSIHSYRTQNIICLLFFLHFFRGNKRREVDGKLVAQTVKNPPAGDPGLIS